MTGTMIELEHDLALLDRAAHCAVRGHGHVEPNPMVGCIATDMEGEIVAVAHHQRHGGPHAEVLAIEMAGARLRGGTLYVTLEPCSHEGRTGPCTSAILDAGVSRVVIGQRDPNPDASGGAEILRAAGIEVDVLDHEASRLLIAPHVKLSPKKAIVVILLLKFIGTLLILLPFSSVSYTISFFISQCFIENLQFFAGI